MESKHILFGLLGIAGVAGGAYLFQLHRLSSELETLIKGAIHKISISGLVIRIDVELKNPTNGSLQLKYPFIKLMHGDTTLGSSSVVDQDINIPKFGQIALDPIYITLPFLSLASSAPALLKEYRSTGGLNLTVRVVSAINGTIPYAKSEIITIGKAKQVT